jgi:tetratricopeptide (TPR) repeat protein
VAGEVGLAGEAMSAAPASGPEPPRPTALSPSAGIWPRIGGAIAYLLLAAAIYAPALNGGWLWDDRENLAGSPLVTAAHPFRLIWSGRALLDYYPVKDSLLWLQWQLWGDRPLWYHVTNVALHVLSALLLWRLLERLGLRNRWAWTGGLLFLVHPMAVGSIAWVSEFKDALSLPPLLAAALCYLDYDRRWSALSPTRLSSDRGQAGTRTLPGALGTTRSTSLGPMRCTPLLLSLGWFIVAMLCKSSVMMFPVCLLLYGWWARRPLRSVLISALPFFVVSAVCGVLAVEFQTHRAIAADGTGLGGLAFRLSLAGRALDVYLAHALWPRDLAPVYVRWKVGGYAWWLPLAALGALLFWWGRDCLTRTRWARTAVLGLGWFAINLIPVLGVVGIAYMRFSWVMDHLAYTSLIGLAGVAAAGLQGLSNLELWPRWSSGSLPPVVLAKRGGRAGSLSGPNAAGAWLAGGLAAAAVVGLAAWARAYSPAYAGAEALWTYTTVHQPRQWVGFDNLGALRIDQGNIPEAESLLRHALALNPDAPDIHLNLAIVEHQLHHPQAAEAELRQALKLRPDFAPAELELATCLAEQRKLAESVPHWQAAIRLVPPSADLHNRYALVLLLMGQYDAGVAQLRQALALDPNWGAAEFSWASVLTQQGNPREALPHFERAAQLLPNDPVVQQQAALARSRASGH